MMLAYGIHLETKLVSEFCFRNNLPQPFTGRDARIGDFRKCGQPKLHGCTTLSTDWVPTLSLGLWIGWRRREEPVAAVKAKKMLLARH